MITQQLLGFVQCPTCEGGSLSLSGDGSVTGEGELQCAACGSTYPVHMGVPALIPHAHVAGPAWELWRAHLAKFEARRAERIEHPDEAVNRLAEKSKPQRPFANFVGITGGRVLDVGCGPGKFRHNFDASAVEYVGLDPMVLPEVADFLFVRGLSEYLPFKADSFTDIVVLAALDHFRDTARFFAEARRVLVRNGGLHIMQSVHEVRGALSAVKVLAHVAKDAIEERWDRSGNDAPKHLSEYTERSLLEAIGEGFSVAAVERFSATWYSPEKLFVTARSV